MQLLTSTSLSGFLTKFFCAILFLTAFCFCSILAYEVDFQGVSDEETLKLIKQVSQLVKLKDQPPATLTALKKRAENDIPNILKVLHSEAKYGAKINYEIKNNGQLVMVEIDSGAVFIIDQININYFDDQENPTKPRLEVDFCDLELEIGTKATPETILNAEDPRILQRQLDRPLHPNLRDSESPHVL